MSVKNKEKLKKAAGRIPHLGNACLTGLRKKCSDLMRELTDDFPGPGGNRITESDFEKAVRSSNGKPFAFDDGNMRSLHFDRHIMQSAMWIDAPDELALGYTKCMMGFLLANERPAHILMIGLGGGSLVKYCHKYLPDTRITVLEIDADVIGLREKFSIPPDSERLQIIHVDALKFVEQNNLGYDVILLDGYDVDGLVTSLLTDEFIFSCKKILTHNGVLVTNLWSESKNLIALISRMSTTFRNSVWWGHSIDSYNLITFAFKSDDRVFDKNLGGRAKLLDQRYWLDFEKLSARLATIPEASLKWLLAPGHVRPDFRNFFFQHDIERKVQYLLAADEMIARTHFSWLAA